MTRDFLVKGLISLIFGAEFAWIIFDRRKHDSGKENSSGRYLPYISGAVLPMTVLLIPLCTLLFGDAKTAMYDTLDFCFGVFLHICLYYLLLMPILPFLRRHISARACAVLWMLPNYLYIIWVHCGQMSELYWVIEVPFLLIQILLAVWLIGFLAVLGGNIISHRAFRARILRDAAPITDSAALEIWQREVEAAGACKLKLRPLVSPVVRTPLSIGLFRRSVRLVLPERDYTPEELALIFRHELIHIGREDSWNKFFLVFCSAMCWFNPLMWMAKRRCFEDLELSCDETVLLDSDDDTKHRYAGLLLRTAGDERGFTTCLSASASALRYRMKSVVEPKKKTSGALVVGLSFFLLCMSCGYVTLAYQECTGAEVIYQSRSAEQYALRDMEWGDLVCTDEAALHRYLSARRVERISGNYAFSELDQEETSLPLLLDTPEGTLYITLSDRFMRLWVWGDNRREEYYYLPDGTDWEILKQIYR